MVVYACGCLNVKIFADAIKQQDVNQSSPLGHNVVEIELGDRGFDFKYGFLIKRETIKTWTVFTCLNCKKKTHSINRELKLILVHKDMECGDENLTRLAASPDFSPVFQIILTDADSFASPNPSSQSFDTLQLQLADISHHLSNFMLKEESMAEERIRRFEEEQREQLAKVRAKALDDKRRMISLLCQRSDVPDPISKGQRIRTVLTKSNSVFEAPNSRQPVTKTASLPISGRNDGVVPDIDRDELFTIDGLDESEPYHSSSDDDDEVPQYVGRTRTCSRNVHNDSLYSASLPVNISMAEDMMRARRSDTIDSTDSDEEYGGPLDPEKIASNMQALSESIPDENRYIFGDRPRPRLNTNNF